MHSIPGMACELKLQTTAGVTHWAMISRGIPAATVIPIALFSWSLFRRSRGSVAVRFCDEMTGEILQVPDAFLTQQWWNANMQQFGVSWAQFIESGVRVFGATAGVVAGMLPP
jgi:hypothetical protein